ncbi:MAG: diadenylate cyclase CdaA [Bacteroidaceae bacterium]|nr:diadenylate cyclase CdaA [Bacteroidaceae bacterium]
MEYFTTFGIKDLIDVLGVALLLFYLYKMMKRSGSLNMFIGIMLFIFVWMLVSQMLKMQLLGAILNKLVDVGVIALIVLFADDIRQFFREIGTHTRTRGIFRWLTHHNHETTDAVWFQPIVAACTNMSARKEGALIVIQRAQNLSYVITNSEPVNADLNQLLIENIFFKNSPLHDGAMVIDGGRIVAASGVLPVSQTPGLPKQFGLRHRAAMGLVEETDAVAVVVSEETGHISAFHNGSYSLDLTPEKLSEYLVSCCQS